jgi:hypothetical protein
VDGRKLAGQKNRLATIAIGCCAMLVPTTLCFLSGHLSCPITPPHRSRWSTHRLLWRHLLLEFSVGGCVVIHLGHPLLETLSPGCGHHQWSAGRHPPAPCRHPQRPHRGGIFARGGGGVPPPLSSNCWFITRMCWISVESCRQQHMVWSITFSLLGSVGWTWLCTLLTWSGQALCDDPVAAWRRQCTW